MVEVILPQGHQYVEVHSKQECNYKENNDEQKVIAIIIIFPVTGKKYSSLKCGLILKKGGSYDTSQVHPKYAHGYIMYVCVCV